jgi:hypothetical protein
MNQSKAFFNRHPDMHAEAIAWLDTAAEQVQTDDQRTCDECGTTFTDYTGSIALAHESRHHDGRVTTHLSR